MKNKLRMYLAVKSALSDNETSWTGLPAFVIAQDAFADKLSQLEVIGQLQGFATVGVSKHKLSVRNAAAKAILKIAKGLRAYCIDNDLMELMEKLKVTHTNLSLDPETEASHKMSLVLEKAAEHINGLGDYGITPARLVEAEILKAEFETLRLAPRSAINERKRHTRSIKVLQRQLDALLNDKLDMMMALMETEHKVFFESYFDARQVVDHGFGGHKSSKNPNSGDESDFDANPRGS